jgi:hypothetical protein
MWSQHSNFIHFTLKYFCQVKNKVIILQMSKKLKGQKNLLTSLIGLVQSQSHQV